MRVLVTGAAGFIGYHTASRLIDRGHEVIGLDNLNSYYDVSLKEARVARLKERERFRFLHVSTDEVYGSLGPDDPAFTETNRHAPNSPYAASKAAADHLVRSYHHTYGLPTLTTNCSNNYGPYQFPEKLIPLMIRNALEGKPLPVYGDGKNVRDWLFVLDHCDAVRRVLVCEGDKSLVGIVTIGDLAEEIDPESVLGGISKAAPNN